MQKYFIKTLLLPKFSVLTAGFLISAIYYTLTAILPIYFIESLSNGGLEWSKEQTFSVVGTYIAVAGTAPFFGGLFADFCIGRKRMTCIGFFLALSGVIGFLTTPFIVTSLLSVALGAGFAKVGLISSVASLSGEERQKNYDNYYLAIATGYVTGNLIANPLFDWFGIEGLAVFVFCGFIVSGLLGVRFCSNAFIEKSEKGENAGNLPLFAIFSLLAVSFFLVSHQSQTSICLFVHQEADRTIGSFTVPTLWFIALGTLSAIVAVPFRRRVWENINATVRYPELLQVMVGFLFSAFSFACLGALAFWGQQLRTFHVSVLFAVNALFFIADLHVRPVLFAAATRYVPARFHTFSSAFVYVCIGVGAKLAGGIAGFVNSIGFSSLFYLCSFVCLASSLAGFVCWQSFTRQDRVVRG